MLILMILRTDSISHDDDPFGSLPKEASRDTVSTFNATTSVQMLSPTVKNTTTNNTNKNDDH